MKRKILAVAVIIAFVLMLAWGTLAYFTAEDRVTNVLTIGSVKIDLKEYDSHGKEINDPNNMPEYFKKIEPGQRIIKRIVVTNSGENTAWVRARIYSKIMAAGTNTALDNSVLSYNVNDLNKQDVQTADGEWEKKGDYYYFSKPLAPNDKAVLFDVVTFNGPRMGNSYQGCKTEIQVIAQAVQYEGNQNCDPNSWPQEPQRISVQNGGESP